MGRKLHLGAGGVELRGFESVDLRGSVNPDHVADVRDLPFDEDSVDVIYFCHGLEHIPIHEVESTLLEWKRVLRSGGKLYLSVPNFEVFAKLYLWHNFPLSDVHFPLMGGQDYRYNFHYSLWDEALLTKRLDQAGFVDIREYDPSELLPHGVVDWSNRRLYGWKISLNIVSTSP